MKICSNCKKEKSDSEFYKDKRNSDRGGLGLSSRCKACAKASSKDWYQKSERYRNIIRNSGLKHRFGITMDDYLDLLENQQGLCAICKIKSKGYLHVDHCHNGGNVRGLLCANCNHGLGNFKDSQVLLKNAIEYLSEFQTV